MIVDDPRVHCIGEDAADTVVECQHNSSGQALLQRTQGTENNRICNLCLLQWLFIEITKKY